MTEIWKDVKGYEGLYQVSSYGRVKSLERLKLNKGKMVKIEERFLTLAKNYKGYPITYLYKNGKRKTITVHRLVAMNFIENPKNKPQVNHKNGIKTDNTVENLEWVTNQENQIHAQKHGLNCTNHVELSNEKECFQFKSIQEAFRFLNKTASGKYKKIIDTDKMFFGYYWKYIQ